MKNENIAELLNLKDSEIDYSDIAETDTEFWKDAEFRYFQKKVDYTIKIDEDLVEWLNGLGIESNQAINNIIRAYYLINT